MQSDEALYRELGEGEGPQEREMYVSPIEQCVRILEYEVKSVNLTKSGLELYLHGWQIHACLFPWPFRCTLAYTTPDKVIRLDNVTVPYSTSKRLRDLKDVVVALAAEERRKGISTSLDDLVNYRKKIKAGKEER